MHYIHDRICLYSLDWTRLHYKADFEIIAIPLPPSPKFRRIIGHQTQIQNFSKITFNS